MKSSRMPVLGYIVLIFAIVSSCRDAVIQQKDYPMLSTLEVSDVDNQGATFSAKILNFGKYEITEYGFIWSDARTEYQQKLGDKLSSAKFEARIVSDLDSGISYVCRAYVKTAINMVIANEVNFLSKGSEMPQITGIYPSEGYDNSTVRIQGQNFSRKMFANKVYVNNTLATVTASTEEEIEFIVPSTSFAGNADIRVVSGTRTSTSPVKFKVLGAEIHSLSTMSAKAGKEVTIRGVHLLQNNDECRVDFGQLPAKIISKTDTLIKVIVPVNTNKLLEDVMLSLQLTTGKKKVIYHQPFTLLKSWERKGPPILSQSMSMLYDNGFTYQDKGYLLSTNLNYLCRYSPETDTWSVVENGDFKGSIYEQSLFITKGDRVYRVGGSNMSTLVKFLWSYHFSENKWTRLPDLPFNFVRAGYFSYNDKIFIVTNYRQVWKCDFENNQYERMNDFPGLINYFFISTFKADDDVFAVVHGTTWKYNPANDSWTFTAHNVFKNEGYSVLAECFSYNNAGYVVRVGSEIYKYDNINHQWNLISKMPVNEIFNTEKSYFAFGNKLFVLAFRGNISYPSPFVYLYEEE